MKLRALLLAGLFVGGQAYAGLFSDDEAREQVRQVEMRVLKLEETSKQQANTNNQQVEINKQQAETNKQQAETNKQQTRSILDLQTQIESQNAELRRLLGKNEELAHSLQDAEKRQKDFYIDLDTRLRHFESAEATALAAPLPEKIADVPAADDPAVENRAYEAAYKLFKANDHQRAIEAFQEFLKKFPDSAHIPNVHYGMGSAYFALKDYKNALASYQLLMSKYSYSQKMPDAMLGAADCQGELQNKAAAKKILKQVIAKYPDSKIANEANKRLATFE